jgi:diaminopimelate epimerase
VANYILRFKKSINKDKSLDMNKLSAYKMDGLGNDFIIFDNRKKSIPLTKDQIIKISDRSYIGCDQVIFINNDKNENTLLTFYNPDGGEISACGNGSRCVAYLLMKEKNIKNISLKTKGGVLQAVLNQNNQVCLNMGTPNFNWEKIPLREEMNYKNLKIKINNLSGKETEGGFALSVGNPHVVFFVDNYNNYDVKKIGPQIENHNYFPKKCNVTFANVINKNHIKIKVWERGAGLTKACGSAACAAAVSSSMLNLTERNVNMEFSQGVLNINWKLDNNIYMTGKVSKIEKIIVNF